MKILSVFFISCFTTILLAQGTEIKGKVVDESEKPLAGVNVIIKGTPQATVTDAAGNYAISTNQTSVTLLFFFIGYKFLEQPVPKKGNHELMVKLVSDRRRNRKLKSEGKFTSAIN